ncbi:MAG: hypothetical protein RLY16_2021 [Bacteroidota bacterium]
MNFGDYLLKLLDTKKGIDCSMPVSNFKAGRKFDCDSARLIGEKRI